MTGGKPIMKKNGVAVSLFTLFAGLLFSGAAVGAQSATALGSPGTAAGCDGLPVIELPMPSREAEKSYLGLTGSGNFKIGQIKAKVVIVEIYSLYCPHCQRMAAQVNDLYRAIERRADLKGKVKLIGIGAKNSEFEVDTFREKYQVPFPLFPDAELELTQNFCAKGTPTFVGVKVDGKGFQEKFYFGEGSFPDNQKFLDEIARSSGLKK